MHRAATASLAGATVLVALTGCSVLAPRAPATVTVTAGSAASSSAPAAASPAPAGDACTLLTAAEARTIVGIDLQKPIDQQTRCEWDSDPNGPTAQVQINVGDGAKKFYDTEKLLDHKLVDVPGLGDEAHQEDGAVFFRKGSTWVALSIVDLADDPGIPQRLSTAAKVIAGRLGAS
jgi:hypothetical protein